MTRPPSTPDQPWTMLRALNWTASYFKKHGIDSPRPSAEILLAHCLGLQRIDLYVRYDQPLQSEELDRFKALIRRRVAREPVAYIVGEREFWSLPFFVAPAVLIPRPETERLVEAALAALPDVEGLFMYEPGTGSGAVSVAVARERRRLRMAASDRHLEAVAVAKKNAARHGVGDRIEWFVGDWLAPVSPRKASFDAVVCNPPYIPSSVVAELQPEVSQFEPRSALDGGADGLDSVRRLVQGAAACLKPGGMLLFEIGYDQGGPVCDLVARSGEFREPILFKDYAGNDRVLCASKR